jgi:hypothetical protein
LYGSVDNIDAWVGGLAEDHLPGASMGELVTAALADQFTRLRDGDRFFYLGQAAGLADGDIAAIVDIDDVSLAWVIRNNTGIKKIQDNVFFVQHTTKDKGHLVSGEKFPISRESVATSIAGLNGQTVVSPAIGSQAASAELGVPPRERGGSVSSSDTQVTVESAFVEELDEVFNELSTEKESADNGDRLSAELESFLFGRAFGRAFDSGL